MQQGLVVANRTDRPSRSGEDMPDKPIVCIQGLGFVGAAMAAAVADAVNGSGERLFSVIGVELDTPAGRSRATAINEGRFPFHCPDDRLQTAITEAYRAGNLRATTDEPVYEQADIVVVDVPLDVRDDSDDPTCDLSGFEAAIRTLGRRLRPGSLVMIETTVPPGTCANVAAPCLAAELRARGLPPESVLLAHSYERVMPGPDYFESIVNYWRVYAGHTDEAADACEAFLSKVVNVADYPLRRLRSTTASETAKVLENSYRAVNIAFIEEWGRLAEAMDVDLFEVVEAVRDRPTHSNIRQPGFGVGGYCLPKDPLFPAVAARLFLDNDRMAFPFSRSAVEINRRMPVTNLDRLEAVFGPVGGKTLLLLGIAYRSDVDDTRSAPAELFYREASARGARVICHDPYVRRWEETGLEIPSALPNPAHADAIVFAVPHRMYREMDVAEWLSHASPFVANPFVYDCDNVLEDDMRERLRGLGCRVESTGRGLGL